MELPTENYIILVLILLVIAFVTYIFFFGQKLLQTKPKSDLDGEEPIKKPKLKNTIKRNPDIDNDLMDAVRNAKRSAKEQNELHKKQKVVEDDILKKSEILMSYEKRAQNIEKKRLEEKRRKEDQEKVRQLIEQKLKEKQEEERKKQEKDNDKLEAKQKRDRYIKEKSERDALNKQKQAEYMARKVQNEERKKQNQENKRIYEENKKRQQEEREKKRLMYKQQKESKATQGKSIDENVDIPQEVSPIEDKIDEPVNYIAEESLEEVNDDALPIKKDNITAAVKEINDEIETDEQITDTKDEQSGKLIAGSLIGSIIPESTPISSTLNDVDISLLGSRKNGNSSLFKSKIMESLDNYKKSQEKVGHIEINLDETPDEGLQFIDHSKNDNVKLVTSTLYHNEPEGENNNVDLVEEKTLETNYIKEINTSNNGEISEDESNVDTNKSNVVPETIPNYQTSRDVDAITENKDSDTIISETNVKRSLFKETILSSIDNQEKSNDKAGHVDINLDENPSDGIQFVEEDKHLSKSPINVDTSETENVSENVEHSQTSITESTTTLFSTTKLIERTSYSSSISSSRYQFGSASLSSPVRSGSNIQIRNSEDEGGDNITVYVKEYTHMHIFNTENSNTVWPGVELEKCSNGYMKGALKNCKSASIVLFNEELDKKSDDFEITDPGEYYLFYGQLKKVVL